MAAKKAPAKKGPGIAGKPPVAQKAAPKRNAQERAQYEIDRRVKAGKSTAGFEKKLVAAGGTPVQNLPHLTSGQNQVIDQTQTGDIALGGQANEMLPQIQQNFDQPFDFSQLPGAPVQGDFNAWRDQQIQTGNRAFDSRMNPIFQNEAEGFEQMMANRGIGIGSEQYEREKTRMEQRQGDTRQQGYFQNAQNAGQNAEQFFGIGTQARGNALSEGLAQRRMPLDEYNALMAAQSGQAGQNLQYSQARGLQDDQQAADKWLMTHQPRGGGGGGGGGTPPAYAQYGFSSPAEYDAYRTQQARDQQSWEWQNNPQYKTSKGPSYGAQLGGGILGSVLGGWASSGFSW